MRGTGPIGYPGAAEVVNMRPPAELIKARRPQGLPCIGDGRQSGTSAKPFHPQRLARGGRGRRPGAAPSTGDRVRIDLRKGEANMIVSGRGARPQRGAKRYRGRGRL